MSGKESKIKMGRSPEPPRNNVQPDADTADLEEKLGDAAQAEENHLHTEKRLLDAWAYAESIVDTVREPMLVLDGKLCVKTASRAFYYTFGVSREATEGRYLYELGNGQWNIPKLRTLLEEILPQEKTLQDFEINYNFPTLGHRVMLLNARTLWRETDHTERVLLAIEDITERKRIEESLLRSNEELQRFAYAAAHDLRSPVHAALNISQILRTRLKGKVDKEEAAMLTLSVESLEQLNTLMKDILTYSETGSVPQQRLLVPLEEPLKVALANLHHHIVAQAAIISVQELPEVRVDRTQMAMLFQNLISNAIKYRRRQEAPCISIRAMQEDSDWRLSISDNGEGFDVKYAPQIFEPFKRLHGSDVPGSGIGLASCKRIVERMGGRLWAESTRGEGSTFYFTIPNGN